MATFRFWGWVDARFGVWLMTKSTLCQTLEFPSLRTLRINQYSLAAWMAQKCPHCIFATKTVVSKGSKSRHSKSEEKKAPGLNPLVHLCVFFRFFFCFFFFFFFSFFSGVSRTPGSIPIAPLGFAARLKFQGGVWSGQLPSPDNYSISPSLDQVLVASIETSDASRFQTSKSGKGRTPGQFHTSPWFLHPWTQKDLYR